MRKKKENEQRDREKAGESRRKQEKEKERHSCQRSEIIHKYREEITRYTGGNTGDFSFLISF